MRISRCFLLALGAMGACLAPQKNSLPAPASPRSFSTPKHKPSEASVFTLETASANRQEAFCSGLEFQNYFRELKRFSDHRQIDFRRQEQLTYELETQLDKADRNEMIQRNAAGLLLASAIMIPKWKLVMRYSDKLGHVVGYLGLFPSARSGIQTLVRLGGPVAVTIGLQRAPSKLLEALFEPGLSSLDNLEELALSQQAIFDNLAIHGGHVIHSDNVSALRESVQSYLNRIKEAENSVEDNYQNSLKKIGQTRGLSFGKGVDGQIADSFWQRLISGGKSDTLYVRAIYDRARYTRSLIKEEHNFTESVLNTLAEACADAGVSILVPVEK